MVTGIAQAETGPSTADIAALEQRIVNQEAQTFQLRQELDRLKRQVPGPVASENPPITSHDLCSLASETDVAHALANPNRFLGPCLGTGQGSLSEQAVRDAVDAASLPVPGRALVASGLQPQFSFGSASEAALTLAVPINQRICFTPADDAKCGDGGNFDGFAPATLTPSIRIETAFDKAKLLSLMQRKAADLDVTSGTSVTLGLDYVRFRKIERDDSVARVKAALADASKACGELHSPKVDKCTQDATLAWIFAGQGDGENSVKSIESRSRAMAALVDSMWRTGDEKERPLFGVGASFKIGTSDYDFSQASLFVAPDTDNPGRVLLRRDAAVPLISSVTEHHNNFKAEGRAFYYIRTDPAKQGLPPRGNVPGVMLLGSLSYLQNWEYRAGTTGKIVCPPASGSESVCRTVNYDRPYRRRTGTAAVELRTEIERIPYLGSIGLAPRFEVGFSDGSKLVDFPIYFAAKDKSLSGGVRLTHSFDGRDALGNPSIDESRVTLFFTPLKFTGF